MANIADVESLRIQQKPYRSVSVTSKIAANKLLLVPESVPSKIVILSDGADAPAGSLTVDLPDALGNRRAALLSQFSDDFVVPAWAVRTTDKEAEANMEVVRKKVIVNLDAKLVSTRSTSKSQSSVAPMTLELPILANTKALNAGDELRVYRPPAVKKASQKRGLQSLALREPQSSSSKARTT